MDIQVTYVTAMFTDSIEIRDKIVTCWQLQNSQVGDLEKSIILGEK